MAESTLHDILIVSSRASRWEDRDAESSSLEALGREYDEMFETPQGSSPPRPPEEKISERASERQAG